MLTALVVGNMIGSGVFLLPASLAHFGTISIFSWIITALGAMLLAMVFAKLSTLFPKTGGPYIYCKEGFGNFIGFQVAYNYWIYMWIGNAAVAVAFTGYLVAVVPQLSQSHFYGFFTSAGIVWFFTIVNLIGMRFAGRFQLILTILKLLPLVFVSLVGLFYIDCERLKYFNVSHHSHFSALSGGAMLTLWAFLGMESASIPADVVKRPETAIPRATILGTGITAIVYIFSTVAIMGVIPMPELQQSNAPFADLAGKLFGKWGRSLIAIAAVISSAGALNGWILLQGHVPLAAAKDQIFPQSFKKVSRSQVPIFGILLSSILVTLLLYLNFNKRLVDQFTSIISLATLSAIIAYLYTSAAEFVIYVKYPSKIDPKSALKTLTISALAFLYTFWILSSAGKEMVFYGILLMFTSLPIYAWVQWQKYKKKVKSSSFK